MKSKSSKPENTVFGYKKWSNCRSVEWKMSEFPNMRWVPFIRILIRWAEHSCRGWKIMAIIPPQQDSCQFEGLCLQL
eukprot:UN17462